MILFATSHRMFEEREVGALQLKIGAKTLTLDAPLAHGQQVEIILRAVVTEVSFPENQITGTIVRRHVVKIEGTEVYRP